MENQDNENKTPLSLGEKRLNIVFKPGNNDKVQNIKERAARKINKLEEQRTANVSEEFVSEHNRAISLAQTSIQEACQHEVQAAEYPRAED